MEGVLLDFEQRPSQRSAVRKAFDVLQKQRRLKGYSIGLIEH